MSILDSGKIDGMVDPDNGFPKKYEKIIIDTDPGIGKKLNPPFGFLIVNYGLSR